MNKLLQKLSLKIEDTKLSGIKDAIWKFINVHPEIFCLSLLAIMCLIFLFFGLGSYPLLDVDETRYAVMARSMVHSWNWMDLKLNAVPFLEKPPLYFWLVAASIKFFGHFSAWTVRLPIALCSAFLVFFTYFVGKKVLSRKFGMLSALILLTSVFFLMLSHIAIIDMVLTVFMTSAIYCAFLANFCEENYKKYYWWYFYLFIGLGFLAKGILALAIPVAIVFLYHLITRNLKEIFKPVNLLPGLFLFLVIAVPWHIIMYKHYGYEFIKEYFLIHHFGRLMGSQYIGRERPLLYFVPVFLAGFMPWTLVFIAFVCDGFKKLAAKFKEAQGTFKEKFLAMLQVSNNEQKLILFFSIFFIVVFALFSSSSTKLPTYILPVFPAAAMLTAYFWWIADERGENAKAIAVTTYILAAVFIAAAAAASVTYYLLPGDIQNQIYSIKEAVILAFYLLAILLLLRLNVKRALSVFSVYVLIMFFVINLSVFDIFDIVYNGGENEIINYSQYSTIQDDSAQLITFDFAVKPSVLIPYRNKVNFLTDADFPMLDQLLQYKEGPTFVIIKNKNLDNDQDYRNKIEQRLLLIRHGSKYSLYAKDVKHSYGSCPDACYYYDQQMLPKYVKCSECMKEYFWGPKASQKYMKTHVK